MKDICACLCLGLNTARQRATGATAAQTGVGSLNDRLTSQMVFRLTEVSLVGSLAVWLEVLCLVTARTVKEQEELCFTVLFSSLSLPRILICPFFWYFGVSEWVKGLVM